MTSKEDKRRKRHIYPLRLRAKDPRETPGPAIDLGNSYLFIPSTDSFVQPSLGGGKGRAELQGRLVGLSHQGPLVPQAGKSQRMTHRCNTEQA